MTRRGWYSFGATALILIGVPSCQSRPPRAGATMAMVSAPSQDDWIPVIIEYTRQEPPPADAPPPVLPNGPQFNIPGRLQIDLEFPVIVPRFGPLDALANAQSGTFLARGRVRRSLLGTMNFDALSGFVAFHEDSPVALDPPPDLNCPAATDADNVHAVPEGLRIHHMQKKGFTGANVLMLVVDTALNSKLVCDARDIKFLPDYSWPKPKAAGAGTEDSHGTMSAYVATMAAPMVSLGEIAPFESPGPRLSTLADAFTFIATTHANKEFINPQTQQPFKGIVVTNSWTAMDTGAGLTDEGQCGAYDVPLPDIYSSNSQCHIVNRLLKRLDVTGVDVVFSAGNGGRCASATTAKVGTIEHANSLSQVLTVGAVSVTNTRLGYSSQGPGLPQLGLAKPDVSAYTEFSVSAQTLMAPQGTSASAAFTAGIIAAIRSKCGSAASPETLRRYLRQHALRTAYRADGKDAKLVATGAPDNDLGWGVVDGNKLAALGCPGS